MISMGWISVMVMVMVMNASSGSFADATLHLEGMTITPHVRAESMRYRKEPEPADGARVQLFFRNVSPAGSEPLVLNKNTQVLVNGASPEELLAKGLWAWHDFPSAVPEESWRLPAGAWTVFTFNGRRLPFGTGGEAHLQLGTAMESWYQDNVSFCAPECWISAVTFLAKDEAIHPDLVIVHLANASTQAVRIVAAKLIFPNDPLFPRVLMNEKPLSRLEGFNGHFVIPKNDRGGFIAVTEPLALTYAVLEVLLEREDGTPLSLWSYLRVKPDRFDISGGWVNDSTNPLLSEVFLKTLKRLHVNTAHIAEVPGYTDTTLYERYPLKYFNRLTPVERYDRDEMLPRIHAVEFLGEPQYGGGRPVPPQEVWRELFPYTKTRLATTLTHSEERIWRDYAGLSDFPHYDAYRVTAPSADAWKKYDRWGGKRIGWGAPLETIGDMCRSLREMNRPMPCAYWSQGPHHGGEIYDKRHRTSPTPDEIRLQAYHGLSTRITSLYWFNLSLQSLIQWRDTLEELGRIGREIRLLEDLLLEGDAYYHKRLSRADGGLDWDITSVCGPRGAVLFALDLDYVPDPKERVFVFGPPRRARWMFPLPAYLNVIHEVFRVDAEGVHDVSYESRNGVITLEDTCSKVGVYVAAAGADMRKALQERLKLLIEEEGALGFDPANNDADFAALRQSAGQRKR